MATVPRLVRSAAAITLGVLALALRGVTVVLPRRPDVWIFGSRGDRYGDNPMYLFEHVVAHRPEIEPQWITGDRDLAERLAGLGRPAAYRWSLRGIRAALRAGVNVYAADAADSNFALTGGATHVNLYHGIPLKRIEFDIEVGPAASVYHPQTLLQRLRSRTMFAPKWSRHDVLTVTSPWSDRVFRRAFDGRVACTVIAVPPRVTAMLAGSALSVPALARERTLVEELAATGDTIILYLPTWRRGAPLDRLPGLPDLDRLDDVLVARRITLVVKAHLYGPVAAEERANIRFAAEDLDVSALLGAADAVITDYSSVAFDFALLGRPVIFVPYDLAEYLRAETGSFTLDYDELTAGRALAEPDQLLTLLAGDGWRLHTLPATMMERLWGDDPPRIDHHPDDRVAGHDDRLVDEILRVARRRR